MSRRVDSSRVIALRDCIEAVGGSVFLPGEADYARASRIWNGAVEHKPAVVVRCRTADEVRLAVRAARLRNFPLSVRGGGHDWVGRSLRHEGMVLDLSAMRRVVVDAKTRVATVAGGATATDVAGAARPYGLAAVTGNCGGVGMSGLTLGGGYGPLTPRFGLALDNLLAAEVALEDGSLVKADPDNNADLFWALRGGGGNFGVVTSMLVRLHDLREVLAGLILFPWSEARTVLRGYARFMSDAPDDLSVLAGLLPTPNGKPAVLLSPCWTGETADGERVMRDLKALGNPFHARVQSMTYAELLSLYDAHVVNGWHYAVETRWLGDLVPDAIEALVAAGEQRTSPLSMVAIHHFHGAGTRVPPTATAFGLRRPHFMLEVVAAWEGGDGNIHRDWARELSTSLAPFALPGGYANLLAPDAHEQIAAAYGDNAERLKSVKQRFDPAGVFTSATPLPM
jgi:FAD/FMN-containing dehydrogenase